MHSGLKLLVAVLLAAFTSAEEAGLPQPSVEVRLQQGVIEGVRSEAGGGRFFYSFKSIPFAQPPVGDLRFKVIFFFFFSYFFLQLRGHVRSSSLHI